MTNASHAIAMQTRSSTARRERAQTAASPQRPDPQRERTPERGAAFESLRRARSALERARQEVALLEEVAQRLAGPFLLSRAHALWKQLEVAGGSVTERGPGLFERLRAARARHESAEAGLRAAEAELFATARGEARTLARW
jgi:hypothetical protein